MTAVGHESHEALRWSYNEGRDAETSTPRALAWAEGRAAGHAFRAAELAHDLGVRSAQASAERRLGEMAAELATAKRELEWLSDLDIDGA